VAKTNTTIDQVWKQLQESQRERIVSVTSSSPEVRKFPIPLSTREGVSKLFYEKKQLRIPMAFFGFGYESDEIFM
jgi:hypothetical protein